MEEKDGSGNPPGIAETLRFAVPIIAVLVLSLVLFIPMFQAASTQEGIDQVVASIRNVGPLSFVIVALIQTLKSVSAFIPEVIVYVIGGMVLGPLWGSVAILLGALLGTVIIYYMVQKLGAPFVHKMVPASTQEKFTFIQRGSHVDLVVFIMFLIPALPKDVFAYLISLTDIKKSRYFVLSTAGRAPSVVLTCFLGSSVINQNWLLLIVLSVAMIPLFFVCMWKFDFIIEKLDQLADYIIDRREGNAMRKSKKG